MQSTTTLLLIQDFNEAASRMINTAEFPRTSNHPNIVKLKQVCSDLTYALKGTEEVSKKLLYTFFFTSEVLKNAAPYADNITKAALLDLVEQLDHSYHLIILNEDPSDRTPGVPRIS